MLKITLLNKIEKLLKKIAKEKFSSVLENKIIVDKTKNEINGDFFTNFLMLIISKTKENFENSFKLIEKDLMDSKLFEKCVLSPNGYINFFISDEEKIKLIKFILNEKKNYGQFEPKKLFYNIEFVSANPTGFLHVGHARNAALGQTLSNIWKKYGIRVENEYYINDAGAQIDKLGMSVFYRYLQLCGKKIDMEEDFYQGEEPKMVAAEIFAKYKNKYSEEKFSKEKIDNKRTFEFFKKFSKDRLMKEIEKDLTDFRVKMKRFYSEKSLYDDKEIEKVLKKISNSTYLQDGALWLKTTKFNDDKDRVLVKSDKSLTYFTPDIAYHDIKLSRGYDKIFNVWGSDHISYFERMKIAMQLLGYKKEMLHVIIMQMVRLTKDGEEFKMSKRSGNSLTLKDLINEIGVESARWVMVSQWANTHLDIEINQFKSKNFDNQLFYVFYTFARFKKIITTFNKMKDKTISKKLDVSFLSSIEEKEIFSNLFYYPHTIENIAKFYETNKLIKFIYSFCVLLNSYYEKTKILNMDEKDKIFSRITLLQCSLYLLESSLKLLDIKPKNKI